MGLRDLDWRAVALGAAVVLLVGVPVMTIATAFVDEGSNAVFPLTLLVLAVLVAGGYVAGAKRPDLPLMHGAAAAFAGMVVVLLVEVILKLADDEDISPVSIAFRLLFAANVGLFGAWLATRRRVQAG